MALLIFPYFCLISAKITPISAKLWKSGRKVTILSPDAQNGHFGPWDAGKWLYLYFGRFGEIGEKKGSFRRNQGDFRLEGQKDALGGRLKKDLFLRAPRTILRRIVSRTTFLSIMSLLCTSMSMHVTCDPTTRQRCCHINMVDSSTRYDVDNISTCDFTTSSTMLSPRHLVVSS